MIDIMDIPELLFAHFTEWQKRSGRIQTSTCDPARPPTAPPISLEKARLDDLHKRRARLVDIYEAGGLTKEEYLTRRHQLDAQISTTEQMLANEQAQLSALADRRQILSNFLTLVDAFPLWLEQADAQEVNRLLHLLLVTIRVKDDQVMEIEFK